MYDVHLLVYVDNCNTADLKFIFVMIYMLEVMWLWVLFSLIAGHYPLVYKIVGLRHREVRPMISQLTFWMDKKSVVIQ